MTQKVLLRIVNWDPTRGPKTARLRSAGTLSASRIFVVVTSPLLLTGGMSLTWSLSTRNRGGFNDTRNV